jgi:CRISPR-associated endonuclease/helicase Cas3
MGNRLLAKTYDREKFPVEPPYAATHLGHISDVNAVARILLDISANQALDVAEIPEYRHRLNIALPLYGWMHDQGKANSHFKDMIDNAMAGRPPTGMEQLLYHEMISAFLFHHTKRIREWLNPVGFAVEDALLAAAGHHRRFDISTQTKHGAMKIFASHPDFHAVLDNIYQSLRHQFPIGEPPTFDKDITIDREAATQLLHKLIADLSHSDTYRTEKDKVYLAILKAYAIAADVAASAIGGRFQERYDAAQFVKKLMSNGGLTASEVDRVINRYVWKRYGVRRDDTLPPDFQFHKFQQDVAASESYLTLAKASCGSGKSLAAYLWAKKWLDKLGRKRIFFTLPTTGTTTEHYKDYALHLGVKSKLSHYRWVIDMQAMIEKAKDAKDEREIKAIFDEELAKIEALSFYDCGLVVSTCDLILGYLSNQLRGVCALPAVLDSVVVFDEIHSYDAAMFAALLVFLRMFPKLPVLLMTASLPTTRLDAIRNVRPDLNVVAGDSDYECYSRYVIRKAKDEDYVAKAKEVLAQNGKVLWIRNTVRSAVDTYEEARHLFPNAKVLLYHSRFKYYNRVRIHREVINQFRNPHQPVVLVATQVAEMSLDLSADLLISDTAPIWAMIQRLGRLNRFASPSQPGPKRMAIFLQTRSIMPYTAQDMTEGQVYLSHLANRSKVSQRDLRDEFEKYNDPRDWDIFVAERQANILLTWQSFVGQTRMSSHTVSIVMERDLARCDQFRPNGEPKYSWLRRHEVNVPYRPEVLTWKKIGPLFIAPADRIVYSRVTGAKWVEDGN